MSSSEWVAEFMSVIEHDQEYSAIPRTLPISVRLLLARFLLLSLSTFFVLKFLALFVFDSTGVAGARSRL